MATAVFKGSMQFPLHIKENASLEEIVIYKGDFLNPVKRYRIFKRPRRFKIEIWLKQDDGYSVSDYRIAEKLDKHELAQLLYNLANQEVAEGVNIKQSFYKVKL